MNNRLSGIPVRSRPAGFSLVELMVVVGVIALLSTIAVSSYSSYTLRASRTEARMALLAVQVAQEKYFLQNNQYVQTIAGVAALPPAGLGISSVNGATGVTSGGHYTLSFPAAAANTYTLQADTAGSQHADSACPTFTINEQGIRTPPDASGCWR